LRKTARTTGQTIRRPVHPAFADILAATPRTD
jgi:hypothetical protein